MKFVLCFFILLSQTCFAQQWQAEAMVGVSGYNGDLTPRPLTFRSMGPAINVNVKYMLPGNYLLLRAGIGYGRISGNDKYNKTETLRERNLNFKSHILEGHIGAELNILDPEAFQALPYLFAGLGIFHFDPFTKDRNNNKVFLRPLGTEGQGLDQSPNGKMYSLTQFCIPMGGGWKWKINPAYEIAYELGARYLLTDYLDDVSTTYANPQALQAERGRIAAELSYRQNNSATDFEGKQRGNSKIKDWYYFTGIKVIVYLNAN